MNADSLFAGLGIEIRGLVELRVGCVEEACTLFMSATVKREISRFQYT